MMLQNVKHCIYVIVLSMPTRDELALDYLGYHPIMVSSFGDEASAWGGIASFADITRVFNGIKIRIWFISLKDVELMYEKWIDKVLKSSVTGEHMVDMETSLTYHISMASKTLSVAGLHTASETSYNET